MTGAKNKMMTDSIVTATILLGEAVEDTVEFFPDSIVITAPESNRCIRVCGHEIYLCQNGPWDKNAQDITNDYWEVWADIRSISNEQETALMVIYAMLRNNRAKELAWSRNKAIGVFEGNDEAALDRLVMVLETELLVRGYDITKLNAAADNADSEWSEIAQFIA